MNILVNSVPYLVGAYFSKTICEKIVDADETIEKYVEMSTAAKVSAVFLMTAALCYAGSLPSYAWLFGTAVRMGVGAAALSFLRESAPFMNAMRKVQEACDRFLRTTGKA